MNFKVQNIVLAGASLAILQARGAAQSLVYELLGYPTVTQEFGERIDRLGDCNGDGVSDLIASGTNHTRVFSGIDGHQLFDLDSFATGSGSSEGIQVSGIGDVNLDGFQDFLTGGEGVTPPLGPTAAGVVRIFSGSDATKLTESWGTKELGLLGSAVDGCGDLSGDGIPDCVAGAVNEIKAYVLSGADGSVVHTLLPPENGGSFFGSGVAGIGDQDLDGTPDVAVLDGSVGFLRIFSGAAGSLIEHVDSTDFSWRVAGAGDLDNDGIAEVMATTGYPTMAVGTVHVLAGGSFDVLRTHVGTQNYEFFGAGVSGGEDIDGDGVPDYLATSWKCKGVQFGMCSPDPGYVKAFSGATGAELLMIEGDDAVFDGYGSAVSFVGDLDGDQVSEFAVGISGSNVLLFGAGQVQVLSPVDLPLTANKHEIGVLAGGTQVLRLDAGPGWAGAPYLVAGTVSGIVPGFDLGAVHLPLNVDAYTLLNLAQPNGFPLLQGFGVLGQDGKAIAGFSFGQGLDPALKGTSVQHIFVLFGPTGAIDFASNSAGLWLF